MGEMLDKLFGSRRKKKDAEKQNLQIGIRGTLSAIAAADRGEKVEVDQELFDQELDLSGMTDADVEATVQVIQGRYKKHLLSIQKDVLREEAEKAQEAFHKFDLEEANRRREALKRLADLELAAQVALQKSNEAIAADSDLVATAAEHPDEPGLIARLDEINREIAAHEAAIAPANNRWLDGSGGGQPVVPSWSWAPIERLPGTLASQARAMLKEAPEKDRKRQLEQTLKKAEAEVERRKKLLAALVEEREAINGRWAEINQWKRSPDAFRIVKAPGPSRDDQKKALASTLGYGANDPGWR